MYNLLICHENFVHMDFNTTYKWLRRGSHSQRRVAPSYPHASTWKGLWLNTDINRTCVTPLQKLSGLCICSTYKTHLKFNNEHNWTDLVSDHSKRRSIFTLDGFELWTLITFASLLRFRKLQILMRIKCTHWALVDVGKVFISWTKQSHHTYHCPARFP